MLYYYIDIENINSSEKKFLITFFYVFTVKNNQVFVVFVYDFCLGSVSLKWNGSASSTLIVSAEYMFE